MSNYPEHEKLQAVKDEAETLSAFWDWLLSQGYHLGYYHEHDDEKCYDAETGERTCFLLTMYMNPLGKTPEAVFGEYFGIDPKKLSAEKDAMYEELRASAAAK